MILLPIALAKTFACLTVAGYVAYASPHRNPADPSHSRKAPAILAPDSYRHYLDRFNEEDQDKENLSIPNTEAWSFLQQNIPLFDCPDKQLEETYYYRWWSYRKHLSKTPDGWVVTEFLPPVSWAGIYNAISCAAGHRLYEGRWLRDPQYAEDYARLWLLPEAARRNYSFWAADAVHALTLATGDKTFERELLPNLVANYEAWESGHLDSNGLFKQIDDRDGMEYSLGGSGYRPSINSYMYGNAKAIAAMAAECGEPRLAQDYEAKAAKIKNLVQTNLWNKIRQPNPKHGRAEGVPARHTWPSG